MGMLVDNAIVVADGILVDLKSGMDRNKAFINTAKKTALPLLGATAVAILAFLPLGMSPNAAGEFLSSLFTVLIISLSLSWIFAMIQTPSMQNTFTGKNVRKENMLKPTIQILP
jgi:Cation/multidrug efflux pump